ncbi:uncharacterized protein Bfra_009193 [Botrytis fragariae]|uniref:Uncharacterized protein n=1 Tax=Botrytis fragariae TaxID=1964551 RepID=A0A8H6EFV4_9HELO|nr:uncharacterized protein Bfra_009193 [Botrytis fragariae]KAF5870646.1 hypothetical protein Bfra_009193 [Botrytis fragariae]
MLICHLIHDRTNLVNITVRFCKVVRVAFMMPLVQSTDLAEVVKGSKNQSFYDQHADLKKDMEIADDEEKVSKWVGK